MLEQTILIEVHFKLMHDVDEGVTPESSQNFPYHLIINSLVFFLINRKSPKLLIKLSCISNDNLKKIYLIKLLFFLFIINCLDYDV